MPRTLKSSDIFWAGQLPRSWKFCRAKYIFVQKNERGNKHNLELLSPTQKFGVIPQTLYEKLTGMTPVKLKKNINLSTLKTIHKGGFCISLRSFQGGFEYSDYEGVISPAYQVFYPAIDIVARYYKYLFKDKSFIEKMNSYAMSLRDGKNIAFEDFGNTRIPLPPLDEQKKIADFLDKKCGEVDALAHNIQQQIDTLEQYKRAIITETVTKGLNPSAPMKDSGIPWIGQIPKHWRTLKVKFISSLLNGYAFDSDMLTEEGHSSVIRIGDITNGSIEVNSALKYDGPTNMLTAYQIKQGDIVIALSGATVGKIGYIAQQYPFTFINQRVGIIRSDFAHFLNYALQAGSFLPFVLLHSTASAQPNISLNTIGNYIIACPNETEQQTIASYLDDKCGEIDALIKTKQEQLAKLEEYKKAIIFEYVTGKKPVPEEER